ELGEAAQDIDHQVRGGAGVRRQLAEYYFDSMAFEIALDHPEVSDVPRQSIDIVNQDRVEPAPQRIIAQTVELGPFHDSAAPALILIYTDYGPALTTGEAIEF